MIPRWTTVGALAVLFIGFIVNWVLARKKGRDRRADALTNALGATVVALVLLREFLGDIPLWIDALLAITCLLIVLFVLVLSIIRLKRYLKKAWSLEGQDDK